MNIFVGPLMLLIANSCVFPDQGLCQRSQLEATVKLLFQRKIDKQETEHFIRQNHIL